MKRAVVFNNVKDLRKVKKILASNYPSLVIDSQRSSNWSWMDVKNKKVTFLFLSDKNDVTIGSAFYIHGKNELQINKRNGNRIRKDKRHNEIIKKIIG